MSSSRRREQFMPAADGSIRFAGRKVDARSLAQELAVFPEVQTAVAANDITRTKELLSGQSDQNEKKELVNMADKDGFRLLHRACALGSVDLMQVLLDSGADPNAKDHCGDAPMHWACFSGNIDAVECLLKGGGDPLLPSLDGKTPLDAALEEKHSHILQLLFARPWNVHDSRAILEAVLARGPIRIKVQGRFLNGRRIWRVQYTILSSMLRALFLYRNKEMTDSAEDCEHIRFQDLLAVRWVTQTRKRYQGRRFNVYVQLEDLSKLKFNFTSSGFDDVKAGDFTVGEHGGEPLVEEDEEASDGGDGATSANPVEGNKKGLSAKFLKLPSFMKSKRDSQKSSGQTNEEGGNKSRKHHARTSSLLLNSMNFGGLRSVCIAFLVDTPKEAKRWVDAFKFAGMQGMTLPCVRIQAAWRGFAARMVLKKMKADQVSGSAVVSRRGTQNKSTKFIPLDAAFIGVPPPSSFSSSSSSTALMSLAKKPAFPNPFSIATSSKRRMVTTGSKSSSAASKNGGGGMDLPESIRNRKTTALALPVGETFTNAEDMSGYLKKRSETGMSGALRLWKNRFVILSHTSAELQYFDPRRRPRKVHRVPFATMLSVKRVEKDSQNLTLALRVTNGTTFRFEAQDKDDRDRWIAGLNKVLPRENVAALQIQRVVRGFLDRKRVKNLRYLALQRAMRKRDEALIRIEEARQRAAQKIEARSVKEEEQVQLQLQEEEREYKRRLKAARRKAAQEALLSESPLPDQWQQFTDKKSGKIYYYNTLTKETTWKRPKAAAVVAVAAASESRHSRDMTDLASSNIGGGEKRSGGTTMMEQATGSSRRLSAKRGGSSNASTSALPPGWRELVDTKTGEKYYFNSATHESTWTRPAAVGAKRSFWSKRFDSNSGHYYYYDERTGASQWEVPADYVEEVEEEEDGGHKQQAEEEWNPIGGVSASRDRRASSTTSNESPSLAKTKQQPQQQERKRTASQKAQEEEDEDDEEAEIERNRRQSVEREEKRRSADRLSGTFSEAAAKVSSNQGSMASPTSQTLKTLQKALEKTTIKRTRPDHWQKFVDPKSGTPYYVNSSTGEKTWTKPAVLGGPKSKKEAWIALKDAEGREYFNNSITGESVWVIPDGERLASAVESPDTDTEIVAAFTRHIDSLMSQFPKKKTKSPQATDDDDDEEDSELDDDVVEGDDAEGAADRTKNQQLDWSMLDEEDDPKHYVALHEKGGLYDAVRTGLILCRLVNRIEPELIDPRAMNIDVDALAGQATTEEQRHHVISLAKENHALFLGAVRALGGQISESCTPEILIGRDFLESNETALSEQEEDDRRKLILEVLWEVLQIDLLDPVSIISCRPLLNLMDSQQETIHDFDGLHESEKLLRWLQYHNPSIDALKFGNVTGTESVNIAASLCCAIWAPAGDVSQLPSITLPAVVHRVVEDPSHASLREEEKDQLFETLANACQALGIRLYASRPACLKSGDARLQVACCAIVFANRHNLPMDVTLSLDEQNELKLISMEGDLDESRDERILRTWINSLNIKLKPGSNAPSGASLSPKSRHNSSQQQQQNVSILRVKNLFFDLRNGVALLHVLQAVKPTLKVFDNNTGKVHLHPENKFHMLENSSVVLDLAKARLNLNIVNLGPFDIVDGNRKLILGLTWQIMRFASLALLETLDTSNFFRWRASPDVPITEQDVLNWANDKVRFASLQQKQSSIRSSSVKFVERPLILTEVSLTEADNGTGAEEASSSPEGRRLSKRSSLRSSLKRSSVENVKEVSSFKDVSLRNGCFLLSLINAIKPGAVNWKHAVTSSFIDMTTNEGLDACERNAKYVVSLAFKLGCSVFLSWEDIVEIKSRALFIFVAGLIVHDAKSSSQGGSPSSRSRSPSSPGYQL